MTTAGLLEGVRVVESASLLTGAATGLLLADMGADVVKVESPSGDLMRFALGQITAGNSPAHLQLNRNKRSVTADLRNRDDVARWENLIAGADILIDGNAVGTLARFGYDAVRLAALNPRLIRCTVTGFGRTGPYSSIPAHGLLMGAVAGAYPGDGAAEGAAVDGRGGGPALSAATAAATAICAALYRRERSGEGIDIDISAADALLVGSMLPITYAANKSRMSDTSTLPILADGVSGPRYRMYQTAEGRTVAFAALEPSMWLRFCKAVDRADLVDAGYESDWLSSQLAELIGDRTLAEWLSFAATHRVSVGPANQTVEHLLIDEQLTSRNVFCETEHPTAGAFTAVGLPAVIDGNEFVIRRHAPDLGEHNDELADGWGCAGGG